MAVVLGPEPYRLLRGASCVSERRDGLRLAPLLPVAAATALSIASELRELVELESGAPPIEPRWGAGRLCE
jgi:hypothetical protein